MRGVQKDEENLRGPIEHHRKGAAAWANPGRAVGHEEGETTRERDEDNRDGSDEALVQRRRGLELGIGPSGPVARVTPTVPRLDEAGGGIRAYVGNILDDLRVGAAE